MGAWTPLGWALAIALCLSPYITLAVYDRRSKRP